MGLTIHYSLSTRLNRVRDIRAVVESLRQMARDLPFKEVGELLDLKGGGAGSDDRDDPDRWLRIQSRQYIEDGNRMYDVSPTRIIAFTAFPGDGCEPANFGLCQYPGFIRNPLTGRRMATRLSGWLWRSFCKTQYASDPSCGGVVNFLRCHLSIVKLLDFAKKTGLVAVEVGDEGDYWEERNIKKLAENVGQWNEMIAAFAGIAKDSAQAVGITVESAISGFQNLEHLEAKGLERLKQIKLKGAGEDK